MADHEFYQLDVFTDRPLAGNPLAVFPDARGLDAETMQAIAREMNLSETTFVFPSTEATREVRFFTPASEIPLAGHPTIGTWWLLAHLGQIPIPPDGTTRITQATGAGVLPVDIGTAGGRPQRVEMTQKRPEFLATLDDRDRLAAALGAPPSALMAQAPAQLVDTALPQLMVPFVSMNEVAALPSGGRGSSLTELLRAHGTDCAMCFALEGATAHCRMFAPGLGVPEDPATGSAAGALGAYLAHHGLVAADEEGVSSVLVEQGIEIGRPSRIEVTTRVDPQGHVAEIRVGGQAVVVIDGALHL